MNEITIEKNVPLPKKYVKLADKYPLGKMEIGDSFFITGVQRETIQSTTCQYGRRTNRKYTVRKTDDGFRVWRIE